MKKAFGVHKHIGERGTFGEVCRMASYSEGTCAERFSNVKQGR